MPLFALPSEEIIFIVFFVKKSFSGMLSLPSWSQLDWVGC